MPSPANVFISYPHDDDGFFERLRITLQPLEARKAIKVWSDRLIEAGAKWSPEIDSALANADAAVLLVNPAFLASPFIREKELPVILERARQGNLRILTVLLRTSSIEHALYK